MDDCQCKVALEDFLKSDEKCAYINGEWGVGKTYLVQQLDQESKFIRLSLFGVSTENDLFEQLKESLNSKTEKFNKVAESVTGAIQKLVPDNVITRASFFV